MRCNRFNSQSKNMSVAKFDNLSTSARVLNAFAPPPAGWHDEETAINAPTAAAPSQFSGPHRPMASSTDPNARVTSWKNKQTNIAPVSLLME